MLIRHSQNIFFILIFSLPLLSQDTINSLDFFPHHVGDIWEYYDPQWPNAPLDQNKILSDSLAADGKYYITTSKDGYFILDTMSKQIFHSNKDFSFAESFRLQYKLDADSGDWWISYQDSFVIESVTVSDAFYTFIWNSTPILTKRMDYYGKGHTGDSLLGFTDYLALGSGLIAQNFDTFPFRRLRGTLINGEQHGTITSVSKEEILLLSDFTLYQNYPNPFNGTTLIKFKLVESGTAKINVYNSIGQTIESRDMGHLDFGEHAFIWDAGFHASGVYFYEVIINNIIQQKKMVLLR